MKLGIKLKTRIFSDLPYRLYLILLILLILIPIFITISVIYYKDSEERIESYYDQFEHQFEKEIENSIKLVDAGWKTFEKSLETDMQSSFEIFLNAYNLSGGDPYTMDLDAIKQSLVLNYDLYIFNASGVIIATTYENDLGLDLSTIPYFFQVLTDIREGDSFFSDRITTETRTGILRKFSYYPTPDHQYILEFGLVSDEFSDAIAELNYLDTANQLVESNSYLSSIRIFDTKGYLIGNTTYQLNDRIYNIIRDVNINKTQIDFLNESTGIMTRYFLVDLYDPNYATDVSTVVEVSYDTNIIESDFQEMKDTFLLLNLFILIVIISSILLVSSLFTRPIQDIVDGVNIIAQGDLNYTIPIKTQTELKSIVESINIMVKERKKIEESLEEEKSYLKKSLHEKDILLKEIHHRVKNNLQIVSSLIRLQQPKMDDPESILNTNKNFQNRIRVMALIHEMLYRTDNLESINLAEYVPQLVQSLFHSFQLLSSRITYNLNISNIMLDLDQAINCGMIINEIVTNSIKYGFPIDRRGVINIDISFTSDEDIFINVSDNGIGVPEDIIFENTSTLGMQLIKGLTQQLGGDVNLIRSAGTKYEIHFKKAH